MSALLNLALTAAVVFAAVWAGTGLLARWLSARGLLADTPNERSLHTRPTPRGAGLMMIPALLAGAWVILGAPVSAPVSAPGGQGFSALLTHPFIIIFTAAALGLTAVSLWDDWRGLHPGIRFAAQWAAVIAVLAAAATAAAEPVFGLTPVPAAAFAAAIAVIWVWFINAFNFMDGIDGLAGVETAAIGAGLLLISFLDPGAGVYPRLWGALFIAAALGFLPWNWARARIFLGDAGSVGLGFLTGWALLTLAWAGHPIPALILPMYFMADAAVTLLRRLLRREKIWRAHREHFYQRAVQNGMSHAEVSRLVAVLNIGLVGCACVAAAFEPAWIGLVLAAVMTGLFLHWLGSAR
ncbi:MAG: MraY family glycosyltransferase [Rhodospirillales bacterium]